MRVNSVLLPIAFLSLTASLSAQQSATPANEVKTYSFAATIGNKRIFEGNFKTYADSVVVSPKSGNCKLAPFGDDAATVARFKCDGVRDYEDFMLAIVRSTPEEATWTGVNQKMEGRREKTCSQMVNPSAGTASAPRCTITLEEGPVPTGPRATQSGKLKVTLKK